MMRNLFLKIKSIFKSDKSYLHKNVPLSITVAHDKWCDYLIELANKNHWNVLEIGSREVTGPSSIRKKLINARYTGFDFYPGNNIDVVGDVHKL